MVPGSNLARCIFSAFGIFSYSFDNRLKTIWKHYFQFVDFETITFVRRNIRGLLKNYADWCYRVKTVLKHPVMKFIWQRRAIFRLSTLKVSCFKHEFVWSYALSKIPTIAAPGHVSDVMSVLLFTRQPYLSYLPKLLSFRLKKPMLELHTLLVGLFWTFKSYKLNLSAL